MHKPELSLWKPPRAPGGDVRISHSKGIAHRYARKLLPLAAALIHLVILVIKLGSYSTATLLKKLHQPITGAALCVCRICALPHALQHTLCIWVDLTKQNKTEVLNHLAAIGGTSCSPLSQLCGAAYSSGAADYSLHPLN